MNTERTAAVFKPWRAATLAVLATALVGCAFSGPELIGNEGSRRQLVVPDEAGIYYLWDDELRRLDGEPEWERETWDQRSNIPRKSEFVIRAKTIATAGPQQFDVGLRKVAWVRSVVSANGEVMPVDGTQWVAVPVSSLAVPVELLRADEQPDLVHLVPRQPLEPGLYSVYLRTPNGSREARFGIEWPQTDKQAYASTVCVDRYVNAEPAYRPCQNQGAMNSAGGLEIHLVKPEKQRTGSGQVMVVSGVIVNASDTERRVPPLAGELRNADGDVLAKWQFDPASSRLAPGKSTSFRSTIDNTPPQTHSVHVNFVNQ